MSNSRRASVLCLALTASLIATLAPLADAAPARCFGRRATIVGTSGADRLRGTAGRDVIVAKGGRDDIAARGGNDLVCAGGGHDHVRLGGGNDRATGGGKGDEITGGRGSDRIFLEGGSDFGLGGPGNDVIDLGPGFFQLADGSAGDDTIIGFSPEQGPSMDLVGYAFAPGPVTVDLAAGQATGDGTDTLISIDGVDGSAYDDTLTGHAGSNFLFGGLGDDVMNDGGNAGSFEAGPSGILRDFNFDAMSGGDRPDEPLGNDTFNGQGDGIHVVFYDEREEGITADLQEGVATGQGTDTLNGINAVAAGPGDDTLLGDGGQNGFDGGAGNDTIDGRGGEDTLILFDAIDAVVDLAAGTATGNYLTFTGPRPEDRPFVWTLAGMENVWGSTRGPDTLRGDEGPNELFGLAGADQLFGLGGPDLLNGGRGSDTGDGGPAADDCISIETATNCESERRASARVDESRVARWTSLTTSSAW
ncbi:MAG: hypothetical protein M3161_04330 [Actinomycetota bacterium]|nr:hypothetical protein [Actinomycetota bacterium]